MKVKFGNESIPAGLSHEGRIAAELIIKLVGGHNEDKLMYTGGCTPFYSPEQWKERGEEYGLESELVVVHDGGDVCNWMAYDCEHPNLRAAMDEALSEVGLWAECCTCWYTAIYKS